MDFILEKKEYAFKSMRGNSLWWQPHLHSHIEIALIEKNGKSKAYADGKEVILEENDLFIAFPNQIHYYEDIVGPMTAHVLILSTDMCPEFKKIFDKYVPESPLVKGAGKNSIIRTTVELIADCSDKMDEYSETTARGALLILLSEIFKELKLEKLSMYNTDILKEIITYCYENYMGDISLESVSHELHLSKYYISRIFNRRLQIGFNDYINSLRIRRACELLKSADKTVTEIAFGVGYNSVRSFNRSFKKIRGTTPKQYQLEALSKKEVYKNI